MMATDFSIIVDGKSDAFTFSDSGWYLEQLGEMYKDTSWHPSDRSASFVFVFEGISAVFTGIPLAANNTIVQIDNETAFMISYPSYPYGTYAPWFQSANLPDGKHTITMHNLTAELDFAIVNVGNQTSLSGKTVIVDNESPSILYSGNWSRNTSQYISGYLGMGQPYGNSTHRSSTPGDTFTFQFTGTSISVYGIFSWNDLGSLSTTFTVDGKPTPQTWNQTERFTDWEEAPNFLYYSSGALSDGGHTLILNITTTNNKTFMLDYITYTPSFATFATMPLLTNTTSTTTSVSVNTSTPLENQPPQVGTSHPLPTASIIGGVVGLLAFGVLVAITWFFLQRRKAKQAENISQYLSVPAYERSYQNVSGANNQIIPRKQQHPQSQAHQRPSETFPALQLSNLRAHNSAVQATVPRIPASSDPHSNINYARTEATEPPPYNALSFAQ